ncbi:MAG: DUF418 domain-containing protein [Chromatiales bacterium]|jgi:uncharacterized protein|nr:DUF418 domain-containing protein [Chromatiales bacterium]
MPDAVPAPVAASERIAALDVTRGAAVLGILLMNIWAFAGPQGFFDYPVAVADWPGAPVATWALVHTLFEGSQRALFSLLFGAGMLLMVEHLERSAPGVSPARVYYRRVGWLIVIGLVDAFVLLWPADILLTYALCGLVLYPCRRLRPVVLLAISLAIMGGNAALRAADVAEGRAQQATWARVAGQDPAMLTPDEAAAVEEWQKVLDRARPDLQSTGLQESLRVMSEGPLAAFYVERARTSLILQTVVALNAWLLDALAVMFLGMAALRAGLLTGGVSTRTLWVMIGAGYGLGLPLSLGETLALLGSDFDPLVDRQYLVVYDLRRVAVAAGHLGVILMVVRAAPSAALVRRLAAVGRMALSNYLAQSILCGLIFYAVGFGLYGRFTGAYLYGVVAFVWALQLAWSPWWLARYRFGPAEWLWRSLTYRQRQPLARAPAPA